MGVALKREQTEDGGSVVAVVTEEALAAAAASGASEPRKQERHDEQLLRGQPQQQPDCEPVLAKSASSVAGIPKGFSSPVFVPCAVLTERAMSFEESGHYHQGKWEVLEYTPVRLRDGDSPHSDLSEAQFPQVEAMHIEPGTTANTASEAVSTSQPQQQVRSDDSTQAQPPRQQQCIAAPGEASQHREELAATEEAEQALVGKDQELHDKKQLQPPREPAAHREMEQEAARDAPAAQAAQPPNCQPSSQPNAMGQLLGLWLILQAADLLAYYESAEAWCMEMGAAFARELADEFDAFADAIGLPPSPSEARERLALGLTTAAKETSEGSLAAGDGGNAAATTKWTSSQEDCKPRHCSAPAHQQPEGVLHAHEQRFFQEAAAAAAAYATPSLLLCRSGGSALERTHVWDDKVHGNSRKIAHPKLRGTIAPFYRPPHVASAA